MGFSPVTCNAVCGCFNYGFLFKLQRLILHPSCYRTVFSLCHRSPSHRFWKFFGGIHQSWWLFCSLLCLRLRRAPWFTPFCFGFISSGELLRLETRLIRAVGTGGGGAGGESRGRVVGRKPKAMSLKKTLNSRGERTVEPAIISWQWFIFPSLPPLEPSWKILISSSEQRYGYYSVTSLLLHLLMTPTRLQRLERLSTPERC